MYQKESRGQPAAVLPQVRTVLDSHTPKVITLMDTNRLFPTQHDETFSPPPQLQPRDRFVFETSPVDNGPGVWDSTQVDVFELIFTDGEPTGRTKVASYLRNYRMGRTFEPFRQRDAAGQWRDYALISTDYTLTSVLDLATGEVIADEVDEPFVTTDGREVSGNGFCPVEFWVPDWWDVHDGSIDDTSKWWDVSMTWPRGDFGFVAGCHWGDDMSWKVQFLDLSRVTEGIITREEKFGYLELPGRLSLKDAIWLNTKARRVRIAVDIGFDLATGHANQRALDDLNRPAT